jgi:transcriptional regulator with XRE-family HTH domain
LSLDKKIFGKALSSERKRLNLQVEAVAEACDIKPGTQYLYEQGKRLPNAEYLELLFHLGFRPHVLLPSATQINDLIDLQDIKNAFMKVDQECRDKDGRLLDLEFRTTQFINRLTEDLGLPK